ncbi:MAG TPA: mechanosensitive ion channel family protein [Thermoanaerobaculia bacterium]
MLDDDVFNGNSAAELLIAAGIASITLLLIWGILAVAGWKVRKAAETETDADNFFIDLVRRTKIWLLVFPAIFLGARTIDLPVDIGRMLKAAAQLAFIAQTALWATGVVDFSIRRYRRKRAETDPEAITTINVFRLAAVSALWLVAVLVAFDNFGIAVTPLITGLGIGGIAVALATQNILSDLFASLSIVIDKPFVVGDFIIVGESMGTVEHIGLKTTHIRALSGEQLVVGNGDLLGSRIRNFKRMAERRSTFRLGVTYQTPAEQLESIPKIMQSAIEHQQNTRFDRAHLIGFGDSSYDFEAVYWILSPQYLDFANTHQAVCLEIVRVFAASGIEFAYPTRTLFVSKQEPLNS